MSAKLSIIIPAYERQESLDRAVRSVYNQIDDTAEIIIVDDASKTPVSKSLDKDLANAVTIKRAKKNAGPAAARNLGLSLAKGEWITFLDSDDAWLPGRFEQICEIIDTDEEGLFVWGSAVLRVDRKDRLIYHIVPPRGLQPPLNSGGCRMCPFSTMLTRRDTFDQIGEFDPELRRLEDYDWFLRFFALGGRMFQNKDARVFVDRTPGDHSEHVRFAARHIPGKLVRSPKIVKAYMGLEMARDAYYAKRYWAFAGHLFMSRNLYRRMGIQIQPVKTRRANSAELDLLSGLESVSN